MKSLAAKVVVEVVGVAFVVVTLQLSCFLAFAVALAFGFAVREWSGEWTSTLQTTLEPQNQKPKRQRKLKNKKAAR